MYRILTENKNPAAVLEILTKHFEDFTVLHAQGCWKGTPERALAIELLTATKEEAIAAAKEIQVANHQEAVIVHYVSDAVIEVQ
jgi:hypothetical protein